MSSDTATTKIVTQHMLDYYFEYDVQNNHSDNDDVLSKVIKTDFKLTDALTGTPALPDSIGSKIVIRNNIFSTTTNISDWATQNGKELKMIEIVVLSATVNKYIKLNDLSPENKDTKILVDPEHLVVILEDEKISKIGIDNNDETGSTKTEFVLRKAQLEKVLEADCYGRTISMSRSQSESEGMIFQLTKNQLQTNWNANSTSVLTRIYFEIPQAMISPDVLVVNVELGIRAIRQSPTSGS